MKTLTKTKKEKPYILTVKLSRRFERDLHAFAHRHDTTITHIVKNSVRRTINEGKLTLEPIEYMTPKLERSLAKIEDDIKHGRNLGASASTDEEIDALFAKIRRGDYAR